ncbi:MAG: efflux RND transporter periplasmic adaptor subunit [Gammaproteobacteria bacterium]|jgi:RND family efflux transporter MFP subunit
MGSLSACGKDKGQDAKPEVVRPAKIVTVGEGTSGIRTFPAEVKASERSELAFRVSGELKQLPAKAGNKVEHGQLLAQLDQTDFKLRLDDRKAKYELAKAQYERADKLVKDRLIPISDFDKAKSNFLAAKADLELAKKDMDYTSLRAPFDGRVSRVLVKNFENVQAKEPIMVVQTVDAIDLEFYVPENIITKVREKPPEQRKGVDVKFDQFPDKTFKAFGKEFDTEADPNTQAYRVIVTMKMPQGMQILPGMTATIVADISKILEEDTDGLIVPVEAVFSAEDRPVHSDERFVWKYDPGSQQVSETAVRVGELTTNGIVITEGLSQGDKVVAAGVHFLKQGQKVRPMVRERGL